MEESSLASSRIDGQATFHQNSLIKVTPIRFNVEQLEADPQNSADAPGGIAPNYESIRVFKTAPIALRGDK